MSTKPNKDAFVLTINAGSSTLRFAVFLAAQPPACLMLGKFERIGLPDSEVTLTDVATGKKEHRRLRAPNHASCVAPLTKLIQDKAASIKAIGHRVVQGGALYREPQKVSKTMLAELRRLSEFDPEHLPAEIA